MIMAWAEMAFGREEARGLPQRGLRLLEEAIEAFQACGGAPEIAHELVTYMFKRPRGSLGQEVGGVAVTLLALADAAGLSAEEEERREVNRVLSRPVEEFSRRNVVRNAAGFKMTRGPSSEVVR
jgi:NTP pyrophosphatase (non-canonical NTP hydrolase)